MVAFYIKLVIFIGIGCYSIFNVRFPSYFYVKPSDGLNLRSEANINSARIITIKYDEEIYVVDDTQPETQLNGLKGKWLKVKYNDQEGYIFSAYLNELSGSWRFIWKNKLSLFGSIVFLFGFLSTISPEKKRRENEKILQLFAQKYGEEVAKAIRRKEVIIGMTQGMIGFMFSVPDKINVTENADVKIEEYCYDPYTYRKQTLHKRRFIFENEILKEYKVEE